MKVLFPTPGEPVMPIRIDLPVLGKISFKIFCAIPECFGELLSISVMALAKTFLSSFKIPLT